MARRPRPPGGGKSAYQRRIERGLAAGKTLQEARGHKAGEHITRRERERAQEDALLKFTTYRRGEIKKYAREVAARDPEERDVETIFETLISKFQANGWQAFLATRRLRNRLNRERRGKKDRESLEELLDDVKLLDDNRIIDLEDLYLIYYH